MKLKRLELSNIRTYSEEVIEFEDGITLFEGDIGSGKSTILTAIEFALFGLGDLSGGDVLRMDQQKGHTTLTFEVEGKEYTIHRELLNKNGKIRQENTYLQTPEGKIPLSTTDLKTKVLEILNFRESSNPKAHSVIFRYAIYTPQEEMKAILMDDAAKRLETLRKAFNIEEYKIARDNAGELEKEIKAEIKFLNEKIKEEEKIIEENKLIETALLSIESQKKELEEKYSSTEKDIIIIRQKIEIHNSKKDELLKKTEALKQQAGQAEEIQNEIIRLEKTNNLNQENILSSQNEITQLQKKQEQTDSEITALNADVNNLKQTKKPELDELQIREKIAAAEKEISSHILTMGAASNEIINFENLIKNKKCPTCSQDIAPETFNEKLETKKSENQKLELQKNKLQEERVLLENKLEVLREFKKIQEEISSKQNLINSKLGQKETINSGLQRLADSIEKIKKEISENKTRVSEKQELLKKTPELSALKQAAEQELANLQQQIAGIKREEEELQVKSKNLHGEIKSLEAQLNSNRETISKNNEKLKQISWLKKKKERHELFVQWLEEYFTGALDAIERHVLSSINQRFNILFSEWFRQLLDNSDINVQIDEAFTPIITQGDWSQTITSLSGGEKTSVALAYRLALNSIIREISTSDSYSLMVLDEPTDGFSKEQLLKVQDVLKNLGCNQIILVSHETELEGCADNIYRIEKRGRISKISKM